MNKAYSSDPLRQFRSWLEEAGTDLVALATATREGAPSARMVLLKGADERGFTFFTNYESRKGHELEENPRAALLFHWPPLGRQVRIEGAVERVGPEDSDAYFRTRPRGAQLAAWASRQSEPVESREALETRFAELDTEHAGEVPRPPHWGGYRLRPDVYEFWQHRDNRLHDRLRYRLDGSAWVSERLSP
ncbi:MAG: pyridoxamine 5'-phosphate oxidase [Gaiellaceae bacterium]